MQSRLLTNLFLLIIAVALGVFLFVDDIDQNGAKKLSTISADGINQIRIHHKQREVVIKKYDQEWLLLKPVEISANQHRIKTLLNLLSTNSHALYNTNDLDLVKYGLDNNSSSISFNNTKISFGIVNPMNNLRYVMLNNELHLIDDNFYPLISSQIGTLIARELLPSDTVINKLILPEDTLSRDKNQVWQSEKEVSGDAITETIYQWTHKQAFAVHNYVERKSLAEINVYIENNDTPIHFSVTDAEPWLIIARPDIGIEYHFNLEDYDVLLTPGASKQVDKEVLDNAESLQVSPDEFMEAIQN